MTRLKFLVVLPFYGGSLPIGRYCIRALMEMGQSVRVFNAPKLNSAYLGLREIDLEPQKVARLTGAYLKFISQIIWEQIQEFEPDIMLALAQAPVDKYLLQRIKQTSTKSVMWFVEDYKLLTYWQYLAPFYDAFAVIQKEPFLSLLKEIGQTHAFYLPLAALPSFHKPVKLTPKEQKEFGSDVSFLGAGYPNRRMAFQKLKDKDFKIWGSDWEGEEALAANIQRNGERINEEDSVKIYNASKINLNLHSSVNTDKLVSGGDFVNPRTFELASIGAFQLVDNRQLIGELFSSDELAVFNNLEEMKDKIDYFLSNPEEKEKYAKRSRERVLKDHTYEKRMTTLIEYMEKCFGPFKDLIDENQELAELSPELKLKIKELTKKLGLSANTSFADLIAKLREQTGPLDELETVILFLDEWKKQYSHK